MKLWNLYFAMSAAGDSQLPELLSISGGAGAGDKAGALTWIVGVVEKCGASISCAV